MTTAVGTTRRMHYRSPGITGTVQAPTHAKAALLNRLAREIKTAHEAALCDHLEHARRAGDLLCKVKGMLPHGQFLPWVQQHCQIVPRTAQLYMQVARNWGRIANAQRVAHLSLRQAVRLLAGADESALDETDLSVGRVVDTYLTKIKRFLVAIKHAQETPERLLALAILIQQRHTEVRQELQRLEQLLAGQVTAA